MGKHRADCRRPSLGRVDESSARRWLSELRRQQDWFEERASDLWRQAHLEENWVFPAANALGWAYGALLARTLTADFEGALQRGGVDGLADAARRALGDLSSFYYDTERFRQLRSTEVISKAFLDLKEKIPEWVNPHVLIQEALRSWSGQGVYFNDFHYSVMEVLAKTSEEIQLFLAHHGSPRDAALIPTGDPERRFQWGPPWIAKLHELPEEEERFILETVTKDINETIAKRTYYGPRSERIPDDPFPTALFWSNAAETWMVDWEKTERIQRLKGQGIQEVTLDANEIIVPHPPHLIEKITDALDPLPLYAFSVEAKEREGYPKPTDAAIRKMLRAVIRQLHPRVDEEELRILAIQWFETLSKAKRFRTPEDMVEASKLREAILSVAPGFIRLLDEWFEAP
jgi:hypothetical protein